MEEKSDDDEITEQDARQKTRDLLMAINSADIVSDYCARVEYGMAHLLPRLTEVVAHITQFIDAHSEEGVTFRDEPIQTVEYGLCSLDGDEGTFMGVALGRFLDKSGFIFHLLYDPLTVTFKVIAEAIDPELKHAFKCLHYSAVIASKPTVDEALEESRLATLDLFDQPKAPASRKELDRPAADSPAVDAPVIDPPTIDDPVVDVPVTDTPAADTSDTDIPDTDAPDAGSPVDVPEADAPAADSPETEIPAADSQAADSPAADSPETNSQAADVSTVNPRRPHEEVD